VRLLGARYRTDPRIMGRLSVDHAALDSVLGEVEAAVRAAQAGTFAPTLQAALIRANALEESLSRAHAELIAREGNPALREFFRKLAEQDLAHRDLLGQV